MPGKQKINTKHILVYISVVFFLIIVLPLASIKFFSVVIEHSDSDGNIKIPEYVKIYRTKKDKTEKIKFEKYICGVVASEMPKDFPIEALKAQAVASRTYALGRIRAGSRLCDSVHCQVYRSDNISPKIKLAVKLTTGEVMLYKGRLAAHAMFFSSSAGKTENSEDVFSTSYPYLTAVSSSFEPGATHKKEVLQMSLKTFSRKLKKAYPKKNFGSIRKGNIRITELSEGGRIKKIRIGKEVLKGTEFRSALELYSARAKVSFSKNKIIITTAGAGHGVGMSQYGAKGMAVKGKNYKQILKHYYRETTIQKKGADSAG